MDNEAFSGRTRPTRKPLSAGMLLVILGIVWIGCGLGGAYTGATTFREIENGQPAILWMAPNLFLAVFLAPFLAFPLYFVLRVIKPGPKDGAPPDQQSVGPAVSSLMIAVVTLGILFLFITNVFINKHDYELCIVGYGKYATTTLMRTSLINAGGCSGRIRNWVL